MDKGMTLKEAAVIFGVSYTAVINWEIIGKIPQGNRMEKVKEFIEGKINNNGLREYFKRVFCLTKV